MSRRFFISRAHNEFTTSTSAITRENTLQTEKKERKEIDSLQFSLMNVEFPISILITPVRLSAVYKIKKPTTSAFILTLRKNLILLTLKHNPSS